MRRSLALVVVVLLLSPSLARADWATKTFKHFVADQKVGKISTLRTDGRRLTTHVLVGEVEVLGETHLRALLLDCNSKRCRLDASLYLGRSDRYFVDVVDLAGAGVVPAPRTVTTSHAVDLDTKKMRWPALVIETNASWPETSASRYGGTVKGSRREHSFSIISLRRRDRKRARVFSSKSLSRAATGSGVSRTYRFESPGKRKTVEIVVESQRHLENRSACIAPDPVINRFGWKEDHFAELTTRPDQGRC